MEALFEGIFDTGAYDVISVGSFVSCMLCSIITGLILALCHAYKTRYTKSFLLTLALLPMVICTVIMMVNGNIGAGVAVAGAFSLVRFRSNPGTAKEIGSIFTAMAVGLICGMGYLGFSLLFTIIVSLISFIYEAISLGSRGTMNKYKTLTITIPENLNYTEVFNETFDEYLSSYDLVQVKTTNLGSLFKLTYDIVEKDITKEKEMIDELRCRNGNLEITISRSGLNSGDL